MRRPHHAVFRTGKISLRLAKGPQLAGFDVGGSVCGFRRSRFLAICLCAGKSRFPES